MKLHSRTARIDAAPGTVGEFSMTLATEGEASDGHVLSISGGVIPDRMPLLTSHVNDPAWQLGSVVGATKHLQDKPPRLRATGAIELGGEGDRADARRDLAHMIAEGHTGAVSIRWEEVPGSAPQRRVNLPSDHPYHVNSESETDERKLGGYYFDQWRALEGSVVSIGADPQALIGRARDGATDEVRDFWRGMIDAETQIPIVEDDELEEIDIDGERFYLTNAAATAVRSLQAKADQPEPIDAPADQRAEPTEETRDYVSPLSLDASSVTPQLDVEAIGAAFLAQLEQYESRIHSHVQGIFSRYTGKVNDE